MVGENLHFIERHVDSLRFLILVYALLHQCGRVAPDLGPCGSFDGRYSMYDIQRPRKDGS